VIALPGFLIVGTVFVVFGDRLARALKLGSERPAERFGLGLAVSFAVVTFAVFLLALARRVSFASSAILLGLMACVSLFSLRETGRWAGSWVSSLRPRRTAEGAMGALAGTLVVLGGLAAMAPPTGIDTLHYHFVAVKRMLQAGGLVPDGGPYFHRTGGFYFPYLLGMALQGDGLAKFFNFAAASSALALIAAAADRLKPGAGVPAAAAAASSPVVAAYLGYEFLELPALMYVSAALYAAVRYRAGDGGRWAAAALAFAGFGLGVKPSNFAVLVLAAFVAIELLRRDGTRAWRPLAAGTLVAAVGAGFWPLWNLASVGRLFPSYAFFEAPASETHPSFLAWVGSVAWFILAAPPYWSDAFGPLLVLGAVGAALFRVGHGGRFLSSAAALSLVLYVGFIATAMPGYFSRAVHSHNRYLSPVLVALGAAAAGVFLRWALDGSPAARRLALAAVFIPALPLLALKAGRTAVAVPAALGIESRDSYLGKKIEVYDACLAVNRLPEPVRVLPLVHQPYFLDRPVVELWTIDWRNVRSGEDLARAARSAGATHVLVEPRIPENCGLPGGTNAFVPPDFREIGDGWDHWDGRRIRLYELSPE